MKIVTGDLVEATLNGDVHFMLHVANCQGKMGSGIAKQVREKIPQAYSAYKRYEEINGLELGTISSAATTKTAVINLHAQEFYGYDGKRYLNYGALCESLAEARGAILSMCQGLSRPIVGVPHLMGCDRAGGDWEIVSEMLEYYLGKFNLVCYKLA